jgi:hypothetical protein
MSSLKKVSADEVLQQMMIEMGIFGGGGLHNQGQIVRLVCSCFGFDPSTVAYIWNKLVSLNLLLDYARLKYLLYMCCYVKTYLTFEQY